MQDLHIARQIFEQEYGLKEHLYIKRKIQIDCFKLLEYEIISHRNEDSLRDIAADAAILKIVAEKEDME